MKILLALVALVAIFSSCIKNNDNPAWIEVNEWTLEANIDPISSAGELTHNFTDCWLYVDDTLIGVFEVPFKVPVMHKGAHTISVYPTIHNNGISATKKIYPFVEYYQIDVTLEADQTVTINPVTRYFNEVNFWIEDFEGGTKITDAPESPVNLVKDNDPIYSQWGYYGKIDLTESFNEWIATSEDMNLPASGAEVYLEIDYYNTNSVETGVLGISSSEIATNPNVTINGQDPSEVQWKKMYIDLKTIVSGSPNAEYFQQSFEANLDSTNTTGLIILDNIKVVHF